MWKFSWKEQLPTSESTPSSLAVFPNVTDSPIPISPIATISPVVLASTTVTTTSATNSITTNLPKESTTTCLPKKSTTTSSPTDTCTSASGNIPVDTTTMEITEEDVQKVRRHIHSWQMQEKLRTTISCIYQTHFHSAYIRGDLQLHSGRDQEGIVNSIAKFLKI
jgi:biopolymer transport protein ExbD